MKLQWHAFAVLALGTLIATAPPAHAYVYSSCGQWASWTDGYYTVYNDEWGHNTPNSQCLYVNSASNWWVVSNETGSGVKGYPHDAYNTNGQAINSFNTLTVTFNATAPSDATYDTAFDCWTTRNKDEIMIWEDWNGAVGPISSSYSCNGACPVYTNVSIGGSYWNVYQGGHKTNTVSFLRKTKRTSGTEDVGAILKWALAHGLLNYSNLNNVQFGFEITATNGAETFTMNSFSSTTN